MAQPQTASIILAAASATAVCAAQTPGGAGSLTINGASASGGVATLDVPRRILVTTAGADASKTLTITGTGRAGAIREVVTLVSSGTVSTSQDFKTVTSVVISAAAAAAISVGTSGVASTRWIEMNHRISPASYGIYVNVGAATANVTVEGTADVFDRVLVDSDMSAGRLADSTFVVPVAFAVSGMSALTADAVQGVSVPLSAIRLTVNSGATTAGVRLTVIQAGG